MAQQPQPASGPATPAVAVTPTPSPAPSSVASAPSQPTLQRTGTERQLAPARPSRGPTMSSSTSSQSATTPRKSPRPGPPETDSDSESQSYQIVKEPSGQPTHTRYSEELPIEEGSRKTWVKLEPGESFIQGLKRLDPKLVSKAKNDLTVFAVHTVLEGEIGKALHHGRTKFYGPGNYAALGVGKQWIGTEKLRKDGDDIIVHQDVTLLSLAENQIAVVQMGKNQYPIGSGQYILRHPTVLEGKPIDIQKLGEKHMTTIITEGSTQTRDPATGKYITEYSQSKREINAGWTAKAGAITLIRPEPGFCYVIQTPSGFRIGREYTYARGEETFHGFMNFLQQSRTTKRFSFFSLDRQRAEMTVQLTWIMKDGVKWLTKGRAYDDPFDMLEEKAEAFFRDAIGAMDHKSALKEKSDGFNTIELEIFTKLSNSAASLGAQLISIEVRELSFPNLELQEVQLAAKEAETRAKKLEAQREIELRKMEDEKLAALEIAKQERAKIAAQAEAMRKKIEDETALAQVEAQSKQALARQRGKAEEEKSRLKAEQEIQAIKADTEKLVATHEAEVLAIKERAKLQLALEKAETEAKAAEALAKALASNPALLELKKLEIWAEVEKERYKTLALFANNPNALLPEALTRDLLRMRHGAHPQEFLPSMGQMPPFNYSDPKEKKPGA